MIDRALKMKIGIFGGTYEGRLLAEFCQKEGISFAVSVATAYGNQLLEDTYKWDTKYKIQTGRMDAEEMVRWMKQEKITVAVDATHPFAQAVSQEIRSACTALQIEYLRLLREKLDTTSLPISWVSSFEEAAALLNHELLLYPERKALLTIGSKELSCFCTKDMPLSRIFVRVLPSAEAITLCQNAGFCGKQIIAMQGPFSCEMNQALIHMVQASYLVTKESGKTGGFEEKIEAARLCGCQVIAVKRPGETEKGKSLEEIKLWLKGQKSPQNSIENRQEFVLLGIGTGNLGQITFDGIHALYHADAFLGAARMVESAKTLCCQLSADPLFQPSFGNFPFVHKQECITYKKEEMLSWLHRHPEIKRPVFLFSGDTGFFSGAKGIYELLRAAFPSALLRLIPGISSLSYFAAAINRPWENVEILSLHGRKEMPDWRFTDKKEWFFLLDGEEKLYQICQKLLENGQETALLWAGENLSYPDEKIICGSPKELLNLHFGKLLVVWVSLKEVK